MFEMLVKNGGSLEGIQKGAGDKPAIEAIVNYGNAEQLKRCFKLIPDLKKQLDLKLGPEGWAPLELAEKKLGWAKEGSARFSEYIDQNHQQELNRAQSIFDLLSSMISVRDHELSTLSEKFEAL